MPNWRLPEQDNDTFFQKRLRPQRLIRAEADVKPEPDPMITTLSGMSLLYEVPFAYLVPSESLLGSNELRFFYMDSNWVRIMLDGACSIGRNALIDYKNDVTFLEEICRNAFTINEDIRLRLQGKEPKEHYNYSADAGDLPTCTGFLLKSDLVSGWRGLEFRAYGDSKDENSVLQALRLETISKDILLGIYRGVIKRLEIKEPPEGFHYGFNRYNEGDRVVLKKSMRGVADGKLIYHKDEIKQVDRTVEIEVIQRGNRVINFAETARNIEVCKEVFGEAAGQTTVNSAHIALEMIQNPHVIRVTAKE